MKIIYGMALGALLLAGCNDKQAGTPAGYTLDANSMTTNVADRSGGRIDNAAMPATPTDAAGYLAKAGAGDMFEIESSRAVLAKNPDKAVKDFAQMMIEAHQQSTAMVKAAASAAGLTVAPPTLDADQRAKLDAIKAADGDAAVTAYFAAQREAHRAALALHQGYAASGDTPQLKTAASEIAPVVQKHIDMLAKLPGA